MSDSDQMIWEAISAVFNGNPSTEDRQAFEKWLSESEVNGKLYDHLKVIGYDGSTEKALMAKDKIFGKVQHRIMESRSRRVIKMWQYVSAASIALLISLGGFYLYKSKMFQSQIFATIETHCPNGTRSKITLTDGTVVNLNSGSTLRYPAQFNKERREVVLDGEAYFEVAKDAKHPFQVNATGIKIKVLGTHFNVKAYRTDDRIITSLLEGSLSVEKSISDNGNINKIVLRPNQQATFMFKTNSLKVQNVKAGLFSSWKEGHYYFDNVSFEEIAHSFERGFNIKIEILSERLKKEMFSGIFDKGENITQILDIMRIHRNFNYTIKADHIEIYEYK